MGIDVAFSQILISTRAVLFISINNNKHKSVDSERPQFPVYCIR